MRITCASFHIKELVVVKNEIYRQLQIAYFIKQMGEWICLFVLIKKNESVYY